MELKITSKIEFPLVGRTHVLGKVTFDAATPPMAEIAKAVALNMKSSYELVVFNHVYSDFGRRAANVDVYVYKDEKSKTLLTVIPHKARKASAKAKFDEVRKVAAEKKAAAEAAAQPASA